MNVFQCIDEGEKIAYSFRTGERKKAINQLLSNQYTKEEAVALVVNMALALPPEEVDFLSDLLNGEQEKE